ncbi:hypothetical protein BH10ACT7_BH10ACT7_09890 [soil metagenome]
MARIVLAVAAELGRGLAAEAVRYGHEVVAECAGADELAFRMRTAGATVAVASADPLLLDARAIAAADESGVRVVALVGTDAQRRHAATLGIFETQDASAEWPEIEQMFGAPSRSAEPAPAIRGTVIAVWGPAGAPGRTTLAISIAAELAALGRSVALADVDTHGASVAPALGLLDEAPGFAAACRLVGADSLTVPELERIGQRYESALGSFWVLTGIGRPSRWPEWSAERVAGVIRQCRGWVEFTVLDTGSSLENDEEITSDLFAPRRNAATVTALHEADRVVAVGSADPVGMSRFMRAHADVIEAAASATVTVVMNRVRASAIGLNPNAQVTRTLARFGGIDSPVLVPHDQSGLDGAILSGRTLPETAPRSAARTAIRDFVAGHLVPREFRPRRGR